MNVLPTVDLGVCADHEVITVDSTINTYFNLATESSTCIVLW